jgi:hypothetical protein
MGDSSQAAQLVQTMAGFGGGGGAAEGLNAAPLGAETSQQPLLTTLLQSYQFYQERQRATGVEINLGQSGISIEKK